MAAISIATIMYDQTNIVRFAILCGTDLCMFCLAIFNTKEYFKD